MKIRHSQELDEDLKGIIKGTFNALTIRVLGALLVFGFNIFLARLLGAEGAGTYFLALSITTIASVITRVGLDNTVLRFVASSSAEDNWVEVKGLYLKALTIIIPASLFITVCIELIASPLSMSVFHKPELIEPLRWMALAILPLSLLTLYSEMLKGLKKITASLSLVSILLPGINLIILLFLAAKMGTEGAGVSYLLATILTAVIGIIFWSTSTIQTKQIQGVFSWEILFNSCLPNYGAALLHKAILPWLPILLLGYWTTFEDVGLYSVSVRTAMLVSFILLAVNSVIAPRFSTLYKSNNLVALGNIARKATWMTSLVAMFVVLPMIIFPEFILSIFGDEFKEASSLLVVLSIGQFINVIFGPVGYLLVMTGNENLQQNSALISALTLLTLLIILIPLYGSLGAAVASVISSIVFNYLSYTYAKKTLGFSTFITS